MTDLPTPQFDPSPTETVVEVPTPEGLLRVEMEQDGDKVTRHDFFLDGAKITKKKALSLGSA